MLPNHAPLVVAEQFALLEAAFPGRIDLGIGRAPGTDPVTSYALRHGAGGVSDEAVTQLPGVRRQRARDDGARGRRARRPGPHRTPLRGDPGRPVGADHLAARLLGLLGPARRGEGHALRLRPPLLRQRHRRGARALPLDLPALARAGRAAHLPHRQRRRRRDRRGGAPPGAAPAADDARAAHRRRRCSPQRLVEEAEKVELARPAHLDLLDAMAQRWVDRLRRAGARRGSPSWPRRTASTR